MNNSYLIEYQDICNSAIDDVVQLLSETEGLKVKDCLISDLVFYNGQPIYSGNGVYLFKSADRVIYVGSCVARNFVERIPAHFDVRGSGWFNSLLQNMVKASGEQKTNATLTQAAKIAMESYSLVLINFQLGDHIKNTSNIKSLEALLRRLLKPYNALKLNPINRSLKLSDYLETVVLVESVKGDAG